MSKNQKNKELLLFNGEQLHLEDLLNNPLPFAPKFDDIWNISLNHQIVSMY